MRTAILMATVMVGLANATTPSFAQMAFGPAYTYPQGYEEAAPSMHQQFGSSDYGYVRQAPRTQRHERGEHR